VKSWDLRAELRPIMVSTNKWVKYPKGNGRSVVNDPKRARVAATVVAARFRAFASRMIAEASAFAARRLGYAAATAGDARADVATMARMAGMTFRGLTMCSPVGCRLWQLLTILNAVIAMQAELPLRAIHPQPGRL